MIVKIGDTLYDSSDVPIMLILAKDEKELIGNMGEQKRYCSFPDGTDIEDARKFMTVTDEILALVDYD